MGRRTGKPRGRPPGAKSQATIERQELHAKLKAVKTAALVGDVTPLEVLLGAMRKAWHANNHPLACAIAKDAAPYVHPRLAATEVTGKDGGALKIEHISDEDRVAALGAFLAKTGGLLPKPTEH